MTIRLVVAATAVAFALISVVPLQAAMPVPGNGNAVENADVIQVAKKKKSAKKKSARQEAEESAKAGTVPSRYRSSVPKEYHQYIPFAK